MLVAAAVLSACAGCLTVPTRDGYASLSDSPVKRRVEEVLPKAAGKAVTSAAGVPSVQGDGGGGRSGGNPEGWSSEWRYHYTFRMVKGPPDWHQDRDKSWSLPVTEYPRVIRSVYDDVSDVVADAGGTVVTSECDGSTFLIRYQVVAPSGQVITGTLRGWVGPEDTHTHDPPLTEPYYTDITIDVREEAGRGK
jgi:hypothetical protein